jgi:hypothetical protein
MFIKNRYSIFWILILFLWLVLACDKGMSPEEEEPEISGVSGTVYFINWPPPNSPPPDTVFDIRLIIFPDFPPADFADEILSGRAILFPGLNDEKLTLPLDSLNYQIPLIPGTYEYFAVAHQFDSNLFNDWQVIGHYDTTPQDTLPTPLEITAGQMLRNINILANFDSILFKL